MRRSHRLSLTFALAAPVAAVIAVALPERRAEAQTIAIGQVTRNPDLTYNPPRPSISTLSYTDCIQNVNLDFTLSTTGGAGYQILVWAGVGEDCSMYTPNRQGGGIGTCWPVIDGSIPNNAEVTIQLPAQAIISQAFASTKSTTFTVDPKTVCESQTSSLGITIGVYFFFTDGTGTITEGTPAMTSVQVDMVGPPPPTAVMANDGDGLTNVTWTPQIATTDLFGYRTFCDPPPSSDAGATEADGATTTTTLVCPEASTSEDDADTDADGVVSNGVFPKGNPVPFDITDGGDAGDDGGPVDSGMDGSLFDSGIDASPAKISDASTTSGCTYVTTPTGKGGTADGGDGGTCAPSAVLYSGAGGNVAASEEGATATDGSASDTTEDASTTVTTPTTDGGVVTAVPFTPIDDKYICAGDLGSPSQSSVTVTGLTNFRPYTIGIAALDNFGNVGPLSEVVCSVPAPVDDFFKTYRDDGGSAGGGFCAISPGADGPAWLGGGLFLAGALLRARRKRRLARTTSAETR